MVSTIVPIPLSPEEVARKVADKMDFARESLLSKGEYLADPDILGRVAWEPVGSGHQLVIKPCPPPTPPTDTSDSDDPTAASTATSTPEPTIGSTAESTIESTTPPSPKGGNESPDTTNVPLPAIDAADEPSDIPSTPAILTIVVQLVPGASWLYPDAKWTKKNDYVPHFQDAKLLCTGGVPLHPAFIQDFDTSVDNLNTIMGELGDKRNKRTTVTTGKPGALVKIRHALFTPYDDPELADQAEMDQTRDWPTSNPDSREALAKLIPTHRVNPLPGYDQNGVLLEPGLYTQRLNGAMVIIRFNLFHHLIRGKEGERSTDAFSARVVQIRVLRPPPTALPATPRKKKLLPTDDYFGSFTPTKRPRPDDDDDNDKKNIFVGPSTRRKYAAR